MEPSPAKARKAGIKTITSDIPSSQRSSRPVLLIDDDVELCQLISEYLAREAFAVEAVYSGEEGVKRAVVGQYAIVILDVMLPGTGGFEVLRQLRTRSRIPVLMLTARGDEQDRIRGLELGADDYLPKPFNPRELSARLQAILRRSADPPVEPLPAVTGRTVIEDIEINPGARTVHCCGREMNLTPVEFDLLALLARSAGVVVSREELVRSVLGRDFSPFDRSIDVHVSNLRKKLGSRTDGSERIKGIRGTGYLYAFADGSNGGEK
jgi:DNA-binding response OmpR family regulator